MKIMTMKNKLFTITLAATVLPAAFALAQSNNDLLPPPLLDGQTQVAQTQARPTVEYLSSGDLERAFEEALTNFGQDTAPTTAQPGTEPVTQQPNTTPGQVPTGRASNEPTTRMPLPNYQPTAGITVAAGGVSNEAIPIGRVRLNVALENMPLEKVMDSVIAKVSEKTGKWEVRWRLKSENQALRNERVNINAETEFETFMAYLMERVNNMTGVQLFVKVFEGSRLIIIADNY